MSNRELAIIVGGGLSGLCCARTLQAAGVPFLLLESRDRLGGRVATDTVDGFLLDRGFQVLLTAYPEAQRQLNYEALRLGKFVPGALIRYRGRFHQWIDPWRRPSYLMTTAFSPVGSLMDKLRVAKLRAQVCRGSLEELYQRPETTTLAKLQKAGFSQQVLETFFRPFLGGIFLERDLQTSSRMFEFVFRMFSLGEAALPACGMQEIARQLASGLPPQSLRLNTPVVACHDRVVRLQSGEELEATWIILACEAPAAAKLLGQSEIPQGRSVSCLYFAAERPPIDEPILVLNGDGVGPINNLCVPNLVSPSYAPAGRYLISVSVLGPQLEAESLVDQVRLQLRNWFGAQTEDWRHLRTYQIDYALPSQMVPRQNGAMQPAEHGKRIYLCGDYFETASIQGAMVSGRRAAEAVIRSRGTG